MKEQNLTPRSIEAMRVFKTKMISLKVIYFILTSLFILSNGLYGQNELIFDCEYSKKFWVEDKKGDTGYRNFILSSGLSEGIYCSQIDTLFAKICEGDSTLIISTFGEPDCRDYRNSWLTYDVFEKKSFGIPNIKLGSITFVLDAAGNVRKFRRMIGGG